MSTAATCRHARMRVTCERAAVGACEAVLVLVGLAFVLLANERAVGLVLVGLWDALALLYVAIGIAVVRRGADAAAEGYWFSMLFTVTARLIGMTAAGQAILKGPFDAAENLLGVTAMILSWLLLHAGWARLYHARAAGGLGSRGSRIRGGSSSSTSPSRSP